MTYLPNAVTDVSGLATKIELDQKANASTVGGLATAVNAKAAQADLTALAATVPVPATAMPPAVADTGATGSGMKYAREDHTHPSKARKAKVQTTNAATYTWVYPSAFAAGVVPVCFGIAQAASGNTDLFNVQIIGAPTNTQCVFQINRVSAGLLGLLLGALSVNPTPATISLHLLALEP